MTKNIFANKNILKYAFIINAILLLIAVPFYYSYEYYIVLRLVSFIVAIYAAHFYYRHKQSSHMIAFIVIAIVFNPIIMLHFPVTLWSIIDIVVAVYMLALVFDKRNNAKTDGQHQP